MRLILVSPLLSFLRAGRKKQVSPSEAADFGAALKAIRPSPGPCVSVCNFSPGGVASSCTFEVFDNVV